MVHETLAAQVQKFELDIPRPGPGLHAAVVNSARTGVWRASCPSRRYRGRFGQCLVQCGAHRLLEFDRFQERNFTLRTGLHAYVILARLKSWFTCVSCKNRTGPAWLCPQVEGNELAADSACGLTSCMDVFGPSRLSKDPGLFDGEDSV